MKRTQLDKQIGRLLQSHGPLRPEEDFSDRVMAHLEVEKVARPVRVITPLRVSDAFTEDIMEQLEHPPVRAPAAAILPRPFFWTIGVLALSLIIIGLVDTRPESFQGTPWLDTKKIIDHSLRQWSLAVGCITGGGLLIVDYLLRTKKGRSVT